MGPPLLYASSELSDYVSNFMAYKRLYVSMSDTGPVVLN